MKESEVERQSRLAAARARAIIASLSANGEFTRIAFVQFHRDTPTRARGIELWSRNDVSLPGEIVANRHERPCRPAWERR